MTSNAIDQETLFVGGTDKECDNDIMIFKYNTVKEAKEAAKALLEVIRK
ncbi:hypothetical protein J2S20_002268 [Moryella indoligenes]|uniref:Uncharacterized protein n=1 Tax=Moryella indoligenes TaxID=371674 RepID=A0AAE3VCG4_9FIRM|nr:hypothetical protein [Moryella indoligenes]MDQ0153547.1 hypothetical protein [Moryella indoligenes]